MELSILKRSSRAREKERAIVLALSVSPDRSERC